MTDRELLELAAKAAGLPVIFEDDGVPCEPYLLTYGGSWSENWNPLEDDGDALRLAVKLEIQSGYSELSGCGFAAYGRGSFDCHEYGPEDPCRATRRVITRAAAEIGKAMP